MGNYFFLIWLKNSRFSNQWKVSSKIRLFSNSLGDNQLFKRSAFLFFLILFIPFSGNGQSLNLMTTGHPVDFLIDNISEPAEWVPYPKDANEWKEIVPEEMYTKQIAHAEKYLDYDWPALKASVFLEFTQNGNRSNFEKISFKRRTALAALVLGESLENEGRFINDIINGIWVICEETFWGIPAHLSNSNKGLPDINKPQVLDLFAAETGMLLAWTDYLVGEKLDNISPATRKRMSYEVDQKIFEPFMKQQFGWMGFNSTKDNRPNNWNPWIISNVMAAALLIEKDKTPRAEMIYRSFQVLDNYLNPYPSDGGCDEGPGYWSRAGASVFDCLDLISMATKNKVNIYNAPLIQNLGTYIYKTYIGSGYFLNFADAAAKTTPPFMVLYRYGKAIGSGDMMSMAADFAGRTDFITNPVKGSFGCLARSLPRLYFANELNSYKPSAYLVRDFWFPEIQIMGVRDNKGSEKGLYFAAKGGNNAESPNHNDIGNFVVYVDGEPAIIDIGVETYTKKTFSSDRYSIWTMQSGFHNLLPEVNGSMQKEGLQYKANNVKYEMKDKKVHFTLDVSGAYPEEAYVKTWEKEFVINRGKAIYINESYTLLSNNKSIVTYMMVCRKPVVTDNSTILLPAYNSKDRELKIKYDSKMFDIRVENYPVEDGRLKSSWIKGELYRLVFTMRNQSISGKFGWEISLVK